MKWKGKIKTETQDFKTKEIIRFAFLPKNIEGQVIWLERYKELHVYLTTFQTDLISSDKKSVLFRRPQWIKISESVI